MDLLAHLQSLEVHLLDPEVRHDETQLTDLLAPDFREFGCSGRTYNRSEVIRDLAAETASTSRTLIDFTLLASTPDWALVTYRSLRRTPAGAIEAVALRSSTWVNREGHWQLLFHQGTLISPDKTLAPPS